MFIFNMLNQKGNTNGHFLKHDLLNSENVKGNLEGYPVTGNDKLPSPGYRLGCGAWISI